MAILAGIDLVAKFFKGDDTLGRGGKRFREFVTTYFQPITPGDEETIYQLRNALLHSFGLYSPTRTKTYRFFLSENRAPLVQILAKDIYQVDLLTLHQAFENALRKFGADLNNDATLQVNFLKMITNYGAIHIG